MIKAELITITASSLREAVSDLNDEIKTRPVLAVQFVDTTDERMFTEDYNFLITVKC